MKFTRQQVSQLLIEKITGIIDPGDDLVIENLLLEDVSIKAEWEKLKSDLQIAEEAGFESEPDVDNKWLELKGRMKAHRHIFSLPRVAAAAAVIAIGFALFHSSRQPVEPSNAMAIALPDEDRVYIQDEKGGFAYIDTEKTLSFNDVNISAGGDSVSFSGNGKQSLNTLSVPRTKNYFVRLSDGTRISMNSKTRLRFPFRFTGNTREVYLEGEAYFKVAKDKEHPFIVHAKGSDIRVLGTEFNVNTYDSASVKTALVEGSVLASKGDARVRLEPGFEALSDDREFTVRQFEVAEVLSWMKGKYFFHNASLEELSSLLTRWYKVKVVFENPAHKRKTFSGEISKDQKVELFLDNLRLSNSIPLRYKDGVLVFL